MSMNFAVFTTWGTAKSRESIGPWEAHHPGLSRSASGGLAGPIHWRIGLEPAKQSAPRVHVSRHEAGYVVYNLDRAQDYRTVVILKRPSDVWRLGPMAVGIWGDVVTIQQRWLLVRRCRHASVVMLLDHDTRLDKTRDTPTGC